MISAKPKITTVTLTNANQDYTFSVPTGTNRFEIKERSMAILIYVAFNSGDIASGNYVTIPYGASWAEIDIKGGQTIYLQSQTPGTVVEIKYWK